MGSNSDCLESWKLLNSCLPLCLGLHNDRMQPWLKGC